MALQSSDIRYKNYLERIDWITVGLFLALVLIGWLNIYAAVYDPTKQNGFFDIFKMSLNSGKQLLWISLSLILITVIMFIEFKLFDIFAYAVYGAVILALIAVLIFGREVAGSKSWFDLGGIRIQPAEFAKFATAMAIARFLSDAKRNISHIFTLIPALVIILIPMLLIILQRDTGSALVFAAFMIVFYREGLPQYLTGLGLLTVVVFVIGLVLKERQIPYFVFAVLIVAASINLLMERTWGNISKLGFAVVLAVGVLFSVNWFVNKVLRPHQQDRIRTLIDPNHDPQGSGWQVTQSKIAIGSGGLFGKGFLKGTQTKFDFVPDQSTDFIFCTIGEEWGWLGSLILIGLYVALLFRLMHLAERQKSAFSRIYAYCVLAIIFFHFMVNIGMTIGYFPVIGIPLPFISYGGSSLWSFTILLFVLIKLDTHRTQLIVK